MISPIQFGVQFVPQSSLVDCWFISNKMSTLSSPAPPSPYVDNEITRYVKETFQLKKELSRATRAVERLTKSEREERESHEETKRVLKIAESKEESAQDELTRVARTR